MATLISDKLDFKSKAVTRGKEVHYILINGSIYQENITIIIIYVPNIRNPNYMRQTLTELKRKTVLK